MSEVTKLAEAEATKAEADTDDEETGERPALEHDEEEEAHEAEQVEGVPAEPEPQEEPSGPVGAVGDKELEKMFKRVETANAGYSKKLGEIMGEEATVLEQCPRCASPFLGFIFPPMMQPVTAEVRDKVLVSVGEAPALATEADPYSRSCDTCKGSGVVRSGSKLNSQKALRCLTCDGRGWIPVGDERRVGRSDIAAVQTTNGEVDHSVAPADLPTQTPDEDMWHRKIGDPDFGVHPLYVGMR